MEREKKIKALREILGNEAYRKNDEVIFKCPCCNHRKPKLSVNLKNDWFHCWICEYGGKNLIPLLKKGSVERKQYIKELEESKGIKKEEENKSYDYPSLPKDFRTLTTKYKSPYFNGSLKYLFGRGLCFDDILKWKLGYCEHGEYKNRIIIPSFDEFGELNFFVGRSFYNNCRSYMHGNFSKDIIWNDYMIDWNKSIVITEGPFDAFKADNAVALQGSILREGSKLFRKIILSGVDVFFALDTDAFYKQLEIIKLFVQYGTKSYYVNLCGKKDVGDMTKEEFIKAKSKAVYIKSELDILRLRVM